MVAAQFTQGAQDLEGSIPRVREGNPAVLDILVRGNTSSGATMQVVLRLIDAGGAAIHTDTALATVGPGVGGSFESPFGQILVPASTLAAVIRWQVARDPKGLAPDATSENDVFPAAGPALLDVVDVAPLNICLVPMDLASHGDVTPRITANDMAG